IARREARRRARDRTRVRRRTATIGSAGGAERPRSRNGAGSGAKPRRAVAKRRRFHSSTLPAVLWRRSHISLSQVIKTVGPSRLDARGCSSRAHGTEDKATDQGGLQMGNLRPAALVLACSALLARASFGDAPSASQQEMRSLDEQVQEIKSDVLGIASDLTRLEEKLLYPSNTQI